MVHQEGVDECPKSEKHQHHIHLEEERRSEVKSGDTEQYQRRDQNSARFVIFYSDTTAPQRKDQRLVFILPCGVGWGKNIMSISQVKKQRPREHLKTCTRSHGKLVEAPARTHVS